MFNMLKKFYFLAGLPRSGNTVLSAILNQHPDIYSSPRSPVSEYMWRTYTASKNIEAAITNNYPERSVRLLSKMLDNYYEDVKKPIILDREKNWAHPANITMLEESLDFMPKIIFTTRPIIEILASFIAIDTAIVTGWMHNSGFKINEKLTLNDNLCDYLMSDYADNKNCLNALNSIDNPDNDGMIHIVKYEDLLKSPQEVMNGIYDFLGIEHFNHSFNNIQKLEKYNDMNAGLPKDLHKIRKVLGRSSVRVEEYLTPRSIEKYKDIRYF